MPKPETVVTGELQFSRTPIVTGSFVLWLKSRLPCFYMTPPAKGRIGHIHVKTDCCNPPPKLRRVMSR
jgi:hypothetical protein